MASEFQAMTFGNILFGGLIGVVVDAASGATHEYPPLVTITLVPELFASIAERDAFYEAHAPEPAAELQGQGAHCQRVPQPGQGNVASAPIDGCVV
jgi:hypothetical protein